VHGLFVEPFQVGFMRRAIAEVVMLGVLGGIVGVHVLMRRLAFLTEVVQHTVFPGIAIAFAFGQSLLIGALTTGLTSVVLMTVVGRRRKLDPDAVMALVFSVFFAIGVVVVSRRRGFQADLTALLFGRILSVDQRELLDTFVVMVACLLVLAMLHKELVMRAFDPVGAQAMGFHIARLDIVLNVIIAFTVVAAIRAMGTVLVVAFVVTPAAAARLLCRRIGTAMAVSAAFAAIGGWLGLAISYEGSVHHGWRLAAGATVVLLLTAGFVAVAVGVRVASIMCRVRRSPVGATAVVRTGDPAAMSGR
jgi:manganese/iron transport system permease protein